MYVLCIVVLSHNKQFLNKFLYRGLIPSLVFISFSSCVSLQSSPYCSLSVYLLRLSYNTQREVTSFSLSLFGKCLDVI